MQIVERPLLITGNQIITPLVEVLERVTPVPYESISPKISKSLDELFPEQQREERDIQKAKDVLGALTQELTPNQLKDIVVEVQFLAESWLDDFERKTFDGLTLNEFLHERGGV